MLQVSQSRVFAVRVKSIELAMSVSHVSHSFSPKHSQAMAALCLSLPDLSPAGHVTALAAMTVLCRMRTGVVEADKRFAEQVMRSVGRCSRPPFFESSDEDSVAADRCTPVVTMSSPRQNWTFWWTTSCRVSRGARGTVSRTRAMPRCVDQLGRNRRRSSAGEGFSGPRKQWRQEMKASLRLPLRWQSASRRRS